MTGVQTCALPIYYVYGLIDPKTKEPFYVGKGKGDRALHHLSENENINEAKQRRIKEIENSGQNVEIKIFSDDLIEFAAFRLEAKLINELQNLTNIVKPKLIEIVGDYRYEEIKASYTPKQILF